MVTAGLEKMHLGKRVFPIEGIFRVLKETADGKLKMPVACRLDCFSTWILTVGEKEKPPSRGVAPSGEGYS